MEYREPVIRIEGLVVRREAPIIQSLNWEVRSGEHWAILGANGSGKTSLLSVVSGYLPPTTGRITVLGQVYGRSDWRELRKVIGIVSSSVLALIPPAETVLETIISGEQAMLGLWGNPSSHSRDRALAVASQVEVDHLVERPWRYLSQGERQRVLIGRALMAEPRLLILDEPCAGLDPVARERFLSFVERLTQSPTSPTLIFVTHHVEEIVPGLTHLLVLREGQVLASGPKREVLTASILSEAFGARVKLLGVGPRYALQIETVDGKIA